MTEQTRRGWNVSPQVVLGLAIVFFGLVLTAGNLGIAPNFTRVIRFWPMVFTCAGLAMVLDRSHNGSRKFFGAALIVVGVWQTAITAFNLRIYINDWWPLLLVALGVFLVLRASRQPPVRSYDGNGGPLNADGSSAREDVVTAFAFMSGVKRNISAPTFRHADLTAVMGGVEIDLRQCTATGGESVLDLFAIWGGIQIRIPADWQVISEVTPVMGGVEDNSGHLQPIRHKLVLKGMVLMGGVEVKS